MAKDKKESSAKFERGRKKRSFLYRQLAEIIRDEIKAGIYKPGDRMMSMDDLAEKHHLNKITVSKALRELVAEGLIYSIPAKGTFVSEPREEQEAHTLSNSVMTIGLVSRVMNPGDTGFYHLTLLEAIRQELGRLGANLMVLPAYNVEPQARIMDLVIQSRLDGAIYIGPFEAPLLRKAVEYGPPSVLVDHVVTGLRMDTICQDNSGGGFQAMSHLLELGHRNIALVRGDETHIVTRERQEGIIAALEQHDMTLGDLLVKEGNYLEDQGYECTVEILKEKPDLTAIYYMNDEMALGGIHAIRETGRTIPDDVSVAGFDDINLAGNSHINLTTIKSPTYEMGTAAVTRLISRFSDRDRPYELLRLATSLVRRKSTAPVK